VLINDCALARAIQIVSDWFIEHLFLNGVLLLPRQILYYNLKEGVSQVVIYYYGVRPAPLRIA
jgi:hypothetical protein